MNNMTDHDWQLIRQLLHMLRHTDEADGDWKKSSSVFSPSPQQHPSGCAGCQSSLPLPDAAASRTVHAAQPPTRPEPSVVRSLIQQREKRRVVFGAELVADPVWDMLLDLTAAYLEGRQVSVTSLCLASGVPQSTALRWIGRMTREGMVERIEDRLDRRRAYIRLSRKTLQDMLRYLASEPHALGGSFSALERQAYPVGTRHLRQLNA